jgi:hypothetical protein
MTMEIGTEAAQFPEKEYINGTLVAVNTICFFYLANIIMIHTNVV